MRIGITDSGVGGLSVCAELEARLRQNPVQEDLEIFYLNAALRDDYSYNAMPSRQQKLDTFDRFLSNVEQRYRPDILYIACNSLSVLFRDPHFESHCAIPISGIVETGTREILSAVKGRDDTAVIIFATPTTVAEGTYSRNLVEAGMPEYRVVQQACPGLPDAISNDFTGGEATALLEQFVPAALDRFPSPPRRVTAFLGCTHYGYQSGIFESLLANRTNDARVINPNAGAGAAILGSIPPEPGNGTVDIRFISPYQVPEKPLASLSHYLGDKGPATVSALQSFIHDPDLY